MERCRAGVEKVLLYILNENLCNAATLQHSYFGRVYRLAWNCLQAILAFTLTSDTSRWQFRHLERDKIGFKRIRNKMLFFFNLFKCNPHSSLEWQSMSFVVLSLFCWLLDISETYTSFIKEAKSELYLSKTTSNSNDSTFWKWMESMSESPACAVKG